MDATAVDQCLPDCRDSELVEPHSWFDCWTIVDWI